MAARDGSAYLAGLRDEREIWIDGARVGEMFAPALAWRRAGSHGALTRSNLGPIWFIVALDMWLDHALGL